MSFKLLDVVVIARDLPEHGLREGDLGTIVELYEDEGVEVEVLDGQGDTIAVVSLPVGDVRAMRATDVPSVRPLRESA